MFNDILHVHQNSPVDTIGIQIEFVTFLHNNNRSSRSNRKEFQPHVNEKKNGVTTIPRRNCVMLTGWFHLSWCKSIFIFVFVDEYIWDSNV